MELTASAPGKLVLLGEYAVLEGAPRVGTGGQPSGACAYNAAP